MPNLQQAITDSRIKGKHIVSEVIGDVSDDGLFAYIDAACNRMGKEVTVLGERLASLPAEDRALALAENGRVAKNNS